MYSRFKKVASIALKIGTPMLAGALAYNYIARPYFQTNTSEYLLQNKIQSKNQQDKQTWAVDQRWGFQPIIHAKDMSQIRNELEMSQQQLKKRTLFFFQKTGNDFIDNQIIKLAELFVQKYFQKICQKFQFIFWEYQQGISKTKEQYFSVQKMGQRKGLMKINDYMINKDKNRDFVPNYQKYFSEQLLQALGSTPEITAANINQFIEQITSDGYNYQTKLIVPTNGCTQQIRDSAKGYLSFAAGLLHVIKFQGLYGVISCDKLSNTILGMYQTPYQQPHTVLRLLVPCNRNIINLEQKQIFKINGKKFTLIPIWNFGKNMVFSPIPSKLSKDGLQIFVNVDLNKVKQDKLDNLFAQLSKQPLHSLRKQIMYSTNKDPIEIIIRKRGQQQKEKCYKFGSGRTQQQIKNILSHSFSWKYPHEDVKAQMVLKFLDQVSQSQAKKENSPYEYFQSQQPTDKKYSISLVGQKLKEQINNNNYNGTHSVVFHYSKNCHSCNKFKGDYEKIVVENPDVYFYRIDNDTNKMKDMRNYNSTPIFAMYRSDQPFLPWHYKMPYFTKSLFENFVKIVKTINPINLSTIQDNVRKHQERKGLISQLLKDVKIYESIQKKASKQAKMVNLQQINVAQQVKQIEVTVAQTQGKAHQKVETTNSLQANQQQSKEILVTIEESKQSAISQQQEYPVQIQQTIIEEFNIGLIPDQVKRSPLNDQL